MQYLKNITNILITIFLLNLPVNVYSPSSTWIHLVDIANPTPLDEIICKYTAYDYVDGDLSELLSFQTNYDHTTCTIGKYDLIVSVKNSKNQTTTHIDQIIVRDFIPPVITSSISELHVNVADSFSKDDLLAYLNYSDNIEEGLQLIINNFPEDTSTEGIYNLLIYCIDSSTNQSNVIEITLYLEDYRFKEIINYTLTTKSIKTKDEVIAILKEENIIPSGYKNIEINSSFFNKSVNSGIYPVEIILLMEDDSIKVLYFKIEYIKNTNPFPMWIIYTISGLIIFTSIFIFVYRKRAQ